MIAALFVHKNGTYFGLPDVDPWDKARDARKYPGPHPVVAHPPCARWCRLAGLVEKRWGHKKGDDGGCFESALGSVRRWGGVLEHPHIRMPFLLTACQRPPPKAGSAQSAVAGSATSSKDVTATSPRKRPGSMPTAAMTCRRSPGD